MGFRRKPALTARDVLTVAGIAAAALAVAFSLVGVDILLAHSVRGGGSILSAWAGARAVIWQQANPYASPVVRLTQQLAYGGSVPAGQNPYFLTIPLHLLLLYFPLALTADPAVARGIWMALSQAALVGTAFLTLQLIDWRPPRILLLFYSLLAVFGVYSVLALLDGSPAPVLGLLYLGVIAAYSWERDELAGALLALCLIDWEAGAPLLILFVLRVVGEKRWNVLAGAAMVLVILGVVSSLASPAWIIPFFASTLAAARTSFGFGTAAGLSFLIPGQGDLAARILGVIVVVLLIFEWATSRGADLRRFVWTCCLALAAAPLLGFRTDLGNLVVLLPAVGLICAGAMQRPRRGSLIAAGFLLALGLLPWYVFARGLLFADQASKPLLLLIYPLLTILGLYWTRWWFARPQQTWLDQVRRAGAQSR